MIMIKKLFKKFILPISFLLIPALLFGALISTLTDNFNDNSLDAAKWFTYTEGGTVLETNNQIEITTDLNGGENDLIAQNTYDLTGSQATIKIVDAGNQALASWEAFLLWLQKDSTHFFHFDINQNTIYAQYKNGGSTIEVASASYVAATFRYLRIREASGTTYWDYSSNGTTWTNMASVANPFVITSMLPVVQTLIGAEASTTTAKVDDFNILPSGYSGQVIIMND